jgi:hypothetical protein
MAKKAKNAILDTHGSRALRRIRGLFLALYFEVFLLISFFEKRPAPHQICRAPRPLPHRGHIGALLEQEAHARPHHRLAAWRSSTPKTSSIVISTTAPKTTPGQVAQTFAGHPQVSLYHKENGGKVHGA